MRVGCYGCVTPFRAVFSIAVMVHLHSYVARQVRHERAVRVGFWTPKSDVSSYAVQVPRELAGRIKSITNSLKVHAMHKQRVGVPFHNARHAALASGLSDTGIKESLTLHKAAN